MIIIKLLAFGYLAAILIVLVNRLVGFRSQPAPGCCAKHGVFRCCACVPYRRIITQVGEPTLATIPTPNGPTWAATYRYILDTRPDRPEVPTCP